MEAITNLANTASKAIWGEQTSTAQGNETAGTEPVSGVQGKGDINEPFDKGNEDPFSTSTHPTSNTTNPTSNVTSLPDRTADKMNPSTSNTFGSSNTHGSDPTGPHDSHLANKADPRIDSDHAGSYGNTHSSHTGSELTGNSTLGSLTSGGLTGGSTGGDLTSDTHSSHTSGGLTGNSTGGGLTGTHSSHTGSGLTGNTDTFGSDPSGPHNTNTANKLDPRVDSDQSGSFGTTGGLTGNTHSSHTSGGLTGATHSHEHGSDPTGPHDSHLSNKADPRVDSDRIGSEGNVGTHSTHTTHNTTPSSIPTNPISGGDRGIHPHEETDKTGVIGGHSDPFKTSKNTASESKSNTGDPSSDAGRTQHQGAANPTDEPSAEDFLKTKDPNDHSGEPMHMHTGAGDGSAVPKTQEERRESKVGNPGGQEHGRETAEGTGEKWVKTSGMAADGGDFDATKPGAGREADRLMEQKGIHKSAPGKPSEPLAETSTHGSHGSSHGTEGKEKVPITQKIKEKLHIGSKHE